MDTNKPMIWEALPKSLYFLHYDNSQKILSIFIDKTIKAELADLLENNRLTAFYKERYFPEHTSYVSALDTEHGFNSCGKVTDFSNHFFKIDFILEHLYLLGGTCGDCQGFGKVADRSCYKCMGRGKELISNKNPLHAITNTLSLLIAILEVHIAVSESKTFEDKRTDQLYMLRTMVERREGGHGLGGSQSPRFTKALASYFDILINRGQETIDRNDTLVSCKSAIESMTEAYSFLTVESKSNRLYGDIRALIMKSGGYYLETEGVNGCTFSTSSTGMRVYWYKYDKGKPISCHNVDSALQQIMLIIGLAKLTECVMLSS